jgi:hypothetical protein
MPQYTIPRAPGPPALDQAWAPDAWLGAHVGDLAHTVSGATAHQPRTQFKLLYDDAALYVAFRVDDRYVRAAPRAYQDPVCEDSCVEFFFTPGTDVEAGYFNLEMNCGGARLFKHQRGRGNDVQPVSEEDARRIEIYHSLPEIVDPEIAEPVAWEVAYRLPVDILRAYAAVQTPAPGVSWRGNLYKCGDATSQPHWLAWAPVNVAQPDFHRPEYFGTLVFE